MKPEKELIEAIHGADFGGWTSEQLGALFDIPAQLTLTDTNEDMIAINRYMSDTVAETPEAIKLKNQWIKWWDSLTWNERNLGTATFDEARNRRNAFQIANDPSVAETVARGGTTEEMEGDARRASSEGFFEDEVREDPPEPLIPSWAKVGFGAAILGGIALGVMKIVGSLNPASLITRKFH